MSDQGQRPGQGFLAWYLGGLASRMSENHLFLFAGGLAFATLLSLVPLVFLVFFVLGAVLDAASLAWLVNRTVEVFIPYGEEASFLKDALSSRIPDVVEFKKTYRISGLSILMLSVSGLFTSMRTILDTVFQASGGEPRAMARILRQWPSAVDRLRELSTSQKQMSFLRAALPGALGKLKDLALVLVVLCAFLLLVLSLPILVAVLEIALSPLHSHLTHLYDLASTALILAVFLGLYWLVPSRRPRMKALATGAFWAALLWKLAEWLFGYYLGHFASIWYLYGAYVLSVALALWLYLAAMLFIVGAEIAQLCHERTAPVRGSPPTEPGRESRPPGPPAQGS